MFQKLIMPGTGIGHLSDKIREEVGFDLEVVAPATHDTGSAVLAVPANDDDFYLHQFRNMVTDGN